MRDENANDDNDDDNDNARDARKEFEKMCVPMRPFAQHKHVGAPNISRTFHADILYVVRENIADYSIAHHHPVQFSHIVCQKGTSCRDYCCLCCVVVVARMCANVCQSVWRIARAQNDLPVCRSPKPTTYLHHPAHISHEFMKSSARARATEN